MYTYIHIPFCKSKCSYCDFYSIVPNKHLFSDIGEQYTGGHEIIPHIYIESLLREAEYYVKRYGITQWDSLYIGGGTPGLLTTNQVQTLLEGLLYLRPLRDGAEVSFEVNPFELSQNNGDEYVHNLGSFGINRISCGIQALHNNVLSSINRRSSVEECIKALEVLQEWKKAQSTFFPSNARDFQFSIDLISGLPGLSNEDFCESLNTVLSYNPDHISLYSLILEENTPLYKSIETGVIAYDEDSNDEQWLQGRDILIHNGYSQYEVSNFSKSTEGESEHNKAYWLMENYIGIGCSACGTIENNRYTATKDIRTYCSFWKNGIDNFTDIPSSIIEREVLSEKDRIFEYLMMGFRMLKGVDAKAFKDRFGLDLEKEIGQVFSRWEKRGLAFRCGSFYALTKDGILYLNTFLNEII